MKYEQLNMKYPLEGIEPATKEQAVWAKNIVFEGLKERLRDEKKSKD